MLGLPHPLSKANLRQTRVKKGNFAFGDWLLLPCGICRAVALTAIVLFFLKIRILIRCLKQGSFSQQSNGESQERCEPCVVRARRFVPPQGLQT